MIAGGGARLRLEEVVIGEVEADGAGREQEERVLASEGANQSRGRVFPTREGRCDRCGHCRFPAVQYALSITLKKSRLARFESELPSSFTINAACLPPSLLVNAKTT